jgi:nucleoside-diphosphate-sugar epimerase
VQLRESNVELTGVVAGAARSAGVKRLIFVSSLAAIGPSASRDKAVSEATPTAPAEPYGRSKLDAEAIVRASGVPFTIVRPAAVYGPRDADFLELFRIARYGLALHPGNREQWISIIHARDLADAIVSVAETDEAVGRVYCLGNETPVQWAELFSIAAECAGKHVRLDVELPSWVVRIGATLGDVIAKATGKAGLWTTGKTELAKPAAWVCSSELARRELALGPETPIERGFCETYRWYVDHGWL